MKALLDGDIILFQACCSTEYSVYDHIEYGRFRYKKDIVNFCEWNTEECELFEKDYKKVTVTEPISNTKHALDSIIHKILRTTDAQDYTLFVAGKGKTFRHKLDYPVIYKGNRPDKPSNFEEARQYLLTLKNVKEVYEIETDDAMGIEQCSSPKGSTVICTIDKDLKGIPGFYYHIDKEETYNISELESQRQFWSQMLTGDRTDNILGIKGIGPKTAEKMLADCKTKVDMMEIVHEAYKLNWPTQFREMWRANRRLLWILREPLKDETDWE